MVGDVSSVPANSAATTYRKVESPENRPGQNGAPMQTVAGEISDRVTLNTPPEKEVTYRPSLTEQERLDTKFLMLRELVANILKTQGMAGPSDAAGGPQGSSVIDIGDGKTADIATMTPEEAQKLVGEDGYWGVKQTSDRIFQQAVGIGGNDPAQIDKIREGILKGFEMARKAFGGELPDISQQTLDAVMKKLDEWNKNSSQSSGQLQSPTVPV